jgi:hypothetical protein
MRGFLLPLNKLKKQIMKLKLLFLALMSFLTLNVFSQFPINVTVIGDTSNCPMQVTGIYADSVTQLFGNITFVTDPNGGFNGYVPSLGGNNQVSVQICATSCNGVTICVEGLITPGIVNTYTIDFTNSNNIDSDNDGWVDNIDCNPFDPYIHPGANEICGDSIDQNCNGIIDSIPNVIMYFVPDSVVNETNSIYIVCQTSGVDYWNWTFGNGESSNIDYPTTNYVTSGTYVICLYAVSNDGCSTQSCLTLVIDSTGWFPGGIMSEYTLNIVPDYTVGVEEIMTNNIKVWPNPVSGMINVSTPSNSGNIKILSIDGRCVYQSRYTKTLVNIDSEILNQGTYVIMINDDTGKCYTTKIIK